MKTAKMKIPAELWEDGDMFFGELDGYEFPVREEAGDKTRWATSKHTIAHHLESDTYWYAGASIADEASSDDHTFDEPFQVERKEETKIVVTWKTIE